MTVSCTFTVNDCIKKEDTHTSQSSQGPVSPTIRSTEWSGPAGGRGRHESISDCSKVTVALISATITSHDATILPHLSTRWADSTAWKPTSSVCITQLTATSQLQSHHHLLLLLHLPFASNHMLSEDETGSASTKNNKQLKSRPFFFLCLPSRSFSGGKDWNDTFPLKLFGIMKQHLSALLLLSR